MRVQRSPVAAWIVALVIALLANPLVGQELTNSTPLWSPAIGVASPTPMSTSWVEDFQVEPVAGCDSSIACDCGDGIDCGNGVDCGCGVGAQGGNEPTCAGAHKPVFYANNFSYLDDPNYQGNCFGDELKLLPVAGGDWGTLDLGGQLRLRYHHEEGMGRQPGISGFEDTTNDFLLTRLRLYQNWKVNDHVRLYSEGIFAYVSANDLYVPRPIDQNSADFLNLFVDLKLTDSLLVRVGRQELLFGAQRLVSPLDWANTRRSFEGVRGTMQLGDWTIDPFYTHLVVVNPFDFDEADYDQPFYGAYATRSIGDSNTMDLYYLGYDNQTAGDPIATDFSLHTLGGRFSGAFANAPLLFDLEGAYQGGRQSGLGVDQSAGFATIGLGHQFAGLAWSPTVWAYYDYASGNVPGGDFNRFNQLFPLAHKYLGFIDAVARSNVSSPNCLLTMSPSQKLSFLAWYYYLGANQAGDIIPPVATSSNQNLTSNYFGNELDLRGQYAIGPRSNVALGYSNLWRGSKIIGSNNAEFVYGEWELNF